MCIRDSLYLARARYRVLILEKDDFGGQITITNEVVNYPGVGRTTGRALTQTMRQQAQDFGCLLYTSMPPMTRYLEYSSMSL